MMGRNLKIPCECCYFADVCCGSTCSLMAGRQIHEYIIILKEQINELKKALRWYANKKNYGKDDWGVDCVVNPPEYGNPGSIARCALKNLNNPDIRKRLKKIYEDAKSGGP